MPADYGNRPLGARQRNLLQFLRRNPGPHFVAMPISELLVAQSLQARGLVDLAPTEISNPGGCAVYKLQATEEAV